MSIIRAGVNVQSGTLQELRQLTRTSVVAETVRPATALDAMTGVHGIEHADDETHHRAASTWTPTSSTRRSRSSARPGSAR